MLSSAFLLCVTSTTVPWYSLTVLRTSSIASSSRWLVGSSSIRVLTCCMAKLASTALARAPGLSADMGQSVCRSVSPYFISFCPVAKSSVFVISEKYCRGVASRGSASCDCVRLPTLSSLPIDTCPPSGWISPISVLSRVLLPTPLKPTIATRSPKSTRNDTGGSGRGSGEPSGAWYPRATEENIITEFVPLPTALRVMRRGFLSTTCSTFSSRSLRASTADAFFPERPARSRLKSFCSLSLSFATCRAPAAASALRLLATPVSLLCLLFWSSYAARCCSRASSLDLTKSVYPAPDTVRVCCTPSMYHT
mmetsp:Transcript_5232/g.12133  ORF Transcript_5232/g.12133 Transcript_5232/m.12133 type:complete len:309 (-) Transcript_5232:866-1792(-)